MKFKIDENLPVEAAATLREAGFDADTIRDEDLSGLLMRASRGRYEAKDASS